MEENTQLPKEVVEQIEKDAEDYASSSDAVNPTSYEISVWTECYTHGATAYATKLQDAQKENADLKRWKQEAIHLLAPIIEYGQGHKDAQLGRSCTEFVLQRSKLYDTLKAQQGPRWVKASNYDSTRGGVLFYRFLGPTLKSCGTGNFSGGVFHGLIGDHFPKDEWEYLYILDESAARREEEWVDVNDRLPYKDGDSSVYCLVNDTYEGIVVRPFNEAHVCWDQEDGDDYYTDAKGGKITHWRPLPEPPKRKQQKEK